MDFARLLKATWEKFIANIIQLVLFTLLGLVLCVTFVLIPTVIGGWFRGMLRFVRDGTPPAFDLLWNFDDYLQLGLLILVQAALVSIGFMLFVVPGVVLGTWWLYSVFYVVDRDMGCLEALGASRDAVMEAGVLNHLVVFLMLAVLSALGGWLSGFGTLFTMPFGLVFMASLYVELPGSRST